MMIERPATVSGSAPSPASTTGAKRRERSGHTDARVNPKNRAAAPMTAIEYGAEILVRPCAESGVDLIYQERRAFRVDDTEETGG